MSSAVGGPTVRLADVRFGYGAGNEILDIPGLEVEPGERVFLFGPSGSGKTTLLGLLSGVLRARGGLVEVMGRDLTAMSSHERDVFRATDIGYIFQLFNLIPYLTVLENITLPCRISRARARREHSSGPGRRQRRDITRRNDAADDKLDVTALASIETLAQCRHLAEMRRR